MKDFDIKKLKREYCFEENLADVEMHFCADIGLFSPKKIDEGSVMLINKMEIENEDSVLDIGCGSGITSSFLKRIVGKTGNVTGIDGSKDRINYARNTYGEDGLEFIHLEQARATQT